MSLRLASLDGYTLLERLFSADFDANPAINAATMESYRVRGALRYALGFPSKTDDDLDTIGLLETLAESLSRSPETALLAGAILRATGQHRATELAPRLAAE